MTQPHDNRGRRPYGTGQLYARRDSRGRETWYARWTVGSRRIKRALGPKRQPNSREGLTRAQAERELRRLMQETRPAAPGGSVPISEAAAHMLRHLEALGRKPTTLATYRSTIYTHIVPRPGGLPIDRVAPEQVEGLMGEMRGAGASPKTIRGTLILLHQIFGHAQRKRWCEVNPCKGIERPEVEESADIRFLAMDEVTIRLGLVH